MEVRDIARSIVNRTGEFGGNVQELAKNILDKQRQRQEFFNQNPEAQKAVNRMKPPMQRAVEFIGKNYLYNPEDKKLFPSSPVHTIQDMMNIQQQRQSGELSEQEARKQLSDKALNMAMVVGELSPSPKAVNNQAARALKMLEEQAKQYDSFDDFVKAQDLYHGTPNKIEGGVLKFGAGDQLKKGGYMGGHFLTDTPEIAEGFSFGGDVYQASGDLKNKVLDVNKNKELFEDFIGKEYVSDGEKVKFTRQAFDYMFPDGKADWSTIDTDLAEQMAKKLGKIGIAIPEYAAGKQGMTYQIFEDNIPVYTKDQLKNIYNKATQPQLSDDLIKEAQKYKSAEEFIKAQGEPVYHGTTADLSTGIKPSKIIGTRGENQLPGIYTTENYNFAKDFSKKNGIQVNEPVEGTIKGNILTAKNLPELKNKYGITDLVKLSEKIKNEGYDAIKFTQDIGGATETVVLNPDSFKSKSQLTDIWNKAMSKVKGK